MSTTMNAPKPADTTIMGIVHDALRRDLRRLEIALAMAGSAPLLERRRALGAHAAWMMAFLHHHHQGEDEGLWPLVRGRAPNADAVFDRMEAEHTRIMPAMSAVSAAAHRLDAGSESDHDRDALAGALRSLNDVLLPHLRHEEDEAMPLVASTLSDEEWRLWDQRYNVKGKPLRQLAAEGHWLMDSLDPARYRVLVHLVPGPARLIIVKGFARRYRQVCAARWGAGIAVGPLEAGAA